MKKSQKGFSIVELLIILVVVGMLGGVGYFVFSKQNSKTESGNQAAQQPTSNTTTTETPKKTEAVATKPDVNTFGTAGDYGIVTAEVYPTVEKINEAACDTNCKQYDYVYLTISKTENTKVFDFLKDKSYAKANAIGAGCSVDSKITYFNSSDEFGSKAGEINTADTKSILAATAAKPIKLEIERLKFSFGKDAPTCYSHFATFKIVK